MSTNHRHVVFYSGGIGSWAAARRVVDKHGAGSVDLLFTDTLIEDEDLYRFLRESSSNLGARLITIAEGRTPWQVFRDKRFIANPRVDICSRVLKRELSEKWLKKNRTPENTTLYVGIDWTEQHRLTRMQARWLPWKVEGPLCEPPLLHKRDLLKLSSDAGIEPPRLYGMGFPHNNCGGFCVKAGQAHFRLLLETMPERYAAHEKEEEEMREFLGKDVAILRQTVNGATKPLTLRALRRRIEGNAQIDLFDWGGCGCFSDGGDDEQA